MPIYSIREVGEHGPPSPAARWLGAQLRSGDPVQAQAAIDAVAAALTATGGNRTHAARELGVAWRTLVRWLDDSPGIAQAVRSAMTPESDPASTAKTATISES